MIIVLYGEDTFRSHEKLLELKKAYLEKNTSSGLFEIDGDERSENPVRNLEQSLAESGLFATKKLVIAKNFSHITDIEQEKLHEYIASKFEVLEHDADKVLIFWDESPKKTNKPFAFLISNCAKKQHFEKLIGIKLLQWIQQRIQLIDAAVRIDRDALELLSLEGAADMFMLENTLRTLVDACDNNRITLTDVSKVVTNSVKSLVFEALEALALGKRNEALRLFEDQLRKGENALYLLTMCAWQMRNMLKVADAYRGGVTMPASLAKTLKLHPFVVQKIIRQMQGFSVERLVRGFGILSELDMQVKKGQLDAKTAVSTFVLTM